uniref:Uncharacterized protein n=1 Tax=Rhizophora mucronata TaxID=61149 RepID=A0A2P2JP35_RHIMU
MNMHCLKFHTFNNLGTSFNFSNSDYLTC